MNSLNNLFFATIGIKMEMVYHGILNPSLDGLLGLRMKFYCKRLIKHSRKAVVKH